MRRFKYLPGACVGLAWGGGAALLVAGVFPGQVVPWVICLLMGLVAGLTAVPFLNKVHALRPAATFYVQMGLSALAFGSLSVLTGIFLRAAWYENLVLSTIIAMMGAATWAVVDVFERAERLIGRWRD